MERLMALGWKVWGIVLIVIGVGFVALILRNLLPNIVSQEWCCTSLVIFVGGLLWMVVKGAVQSSREQK
jgi:hypothetical protein